MFLQETQLRARNMDKIKFQLDFPNYLTIDYVGRNRGFALLLNFEVHVMIQSYSENHIHTTILDSNAIIDQD